MTHSRERKSQILRQLARAESGQSMLELAVCLPLFALLILGTAEIANIAWASIQLNNAAHAGAQFGSQGRAWAANISGIETAAQNEAPSLTITFPSAPTQACSCLDATGASAGTGCDTLVECLSPNTIFDNVTVTVQAAVTPLVHYPGLPSSYTLNAQATMGVIK